MQHIVDYEKYCKTCKHQKVSETEDPCNDCLTYPVADDSKKPIRYEEDKDTNKKSRKIQASL